MSSDFPFDVVIFDLDGTIVDSEPAALKALRACFERWQIEVEDEDFHFLTGRTVEVTLERFQEKYGFSMDLGKASREIQECYDETLKKGLIPVKGVVSAIQSFAKELPLGLVSGSYRSQITRVLESFEVLSHFQVILGAEDYPRSKPAPDGYLKASEMFGASPDRILVFEDSSAGIESALSAGMKVVAVSCTNSTGQDQTRAHHCIQDFEGVGLSELSRLV